MEIKYCGRFMRKTCVDVAALILVVIALFSTASAAHYNEKNVYTSPKDKIAGLSIEVEKTVWDPDAEAWVKEIDTAVTTTLKLRIVLQNTGDIDLFNVVLIDKLPNYLQYADNATPFEPDTSTNTTLVWNIGSLGHCCGADRVEIRYFSYVKSDGNGLSNVTVTAESEAGPVSDSDSVGINAFLDDISPSLQIIKPTKGVYVQNNKIFPFFMTIVVGIVDIEVEASDVGLGVSRVEFYVDDKMRANNSDPPYVYAWDENAFGRHIIRVTAYDKAGNYAEDSAVVWKIL